MQKSYFDLRKKIGPTITPASLAADPEQEALLLKHHQNLYELYQQKGVKELLLNDDVAIPCTEDREGYFGDCHLGYWLSGLDDRQKVIRLIPQAAKARVMLDFGGASGRVARHWLQTNPKCEVILADLNINHIDFVSKKFPTRLRPIKLSSQPQIMLPDNSCDLIVAYSVFTHIDVYETSWLAELARVLKPSGHALLTTHTEHTWAALPDIHVHGVLSLNAEFNKLYPRNLELPKGKHVFESAVDHHDYNCNVFHHSSYLKRQWKRWFHVLDIVPHAHSYQTAVVLQKRNLP